MSSALVGQRLLDGLLLLGVRGLIRKVGASDQGDTQDQRHDQHQERGYDFLHEFTSKTDFCFCWCKTYIKKDPVGSYPSSLAYNVGEIKKGTRISSDAT